MPNRTFSAKSGPNHTRRCDREDPDNFCISLTFSNPTYSFAARGAENFAENALPIVKHHNFHCKKVCR